MPSSAVYCTRLRSSFAKAFAILTLGLFSLAEESYASAFALWDAGVVEGSRLRRSDDLDQLIRRHAIEDRREHLGTQPVEAADSLQRLKHPGDGKLALPRRQPELNAVLDIAAAWRNYRSGIGRLLFWPRSKLRNAVRIVGENRGPVGKTPHEERHQPV